MTDDSIFAAALDFLSPEERASYLNSACDTPDQRARLDTLLAAHDRAGSFLGRPAVAADSDGDVTHTTAPDGPVTRTLGPLSGDPTDETDATAFLAPPGRPDSLGRIGHYEVLEVLGRGGFGIVFRAFDDVLQRVVAVKVLTPHMAATSPARKRFLREARSAALVQHEHVVRIHETGEVPLPYLVMEFVPGETLQQRMDRTGPLETAEAVKFARQVAAGLAAAHDKGLIHRDIKPSNVLIDAGPQQAKITDFGLARAADDASLTRSGAVAGTPMYMAPEQARGEALDQRADLFSLGSVLYAMLTGRPPFRASNTPAVLKRVAEDEPRPIREVIPEVPEWLCRIVGKLHAKTPGERFQTAKEVADLLADCEKQLAERKELTDYSRIPGGKPVVRKPRRWKWVGAGITAALLVLLVALWGNLIPRVKRSFHHELTVQLPDTATVVQFWETTDTVERENRWTFTGEWPLEPRATVANTREQKLRLPPGNYYMLVSKNGKRVEQRLLSIGWGGSQTLAVAAVPPPPSATGFTPLFDGKTLSGWKEFPAGRGSWTVENGVLVGKGKPSHLFTERGDFGNFHLRMEFRIRGGKKAGAVGVFTHVPVEDPGVRLMPEGGGILTTLKREPMPKLYDPPDAPVPPSADRDQPRIVWGGDLKGTTFLGRPVWPAEWETCEVIVDGKRVEFRVTDRGTQNMLGGQRAGQTAGHIALQLFDDWSVVEVRKIEIKELPAAPPASDGFTPLFNGKDLSGWTTRWPPNKTWAVENGVLTGRGELNLLRTAREDYANFHLRAEVRLNAVGNSGVLFRSQPGGQRPRPCYECEIGGAADATTGSLSVDAGQTWLAAAKHNHAPPDTWFTLEVIAAGDRLTTKVNGWPVGQTTDARYRTGCIELQVMNPTTVVEFRKVEIKELPAGAAPPPTAVAPFDAKQAKVHQEAWAKHLGVKVEHTNSLGMKLRLIPPGTFPMKPDYRVTLTKPLRVAAHEVTVAQFRAFVEATGYKTTAEVEGNGAVVFIGAKREEHLKGPEYTWRHKGVSRGDDYPVGQVSGKDAAAFCQWLSRTEGRKYRLPTEAEWEWACRAGSLAAYHFGDDPRSLPEYDWFADNSDDHTHPVGTRRPNAWGLFDVHGNVAEHCLDWYAPLGTGAATDPRGPSTGQHRVIRGNSFVNPSPRLTTSSRSSYDPNWSMNHFGIRVVCEEVEQTPASAPRPVPKTVADVLPFLAGSWKVEAQALDPKLPSGQPPTAEYFTHEWVSNGKFLRGRVSQGLVIHAFDTDKNVQRHWAAWPDGTAYGPVVGEFNPDNRSMVWRRRVDSGGESIHMVEFVDPNTVNTRLFQRDARDKLVHDIRLKFTRVQGAFPPPRGLIDPTRPAEMKVLDRLAGEWSSEQTVTDAAAADKPKKQTTRTTAGLILGGRFVEKFVTNETTGTNDYTLIWYDPAAKRYRRWYFADNGQFLELAGTWHDGTKTLAWTATDDTVFVSEVFQGDDRSEFHITFKDKGGKTVRETIGVHRRVAPAGDSREVPKTAADFLPFVRGTWSRDGEVVEPKAKAARVGGQLALDLVAGGKVMRGLNVDEHATPTSLILHAYDPATGRLSSWYFSPDGTATSSDACAYDPADRTFNWFEKVPGGGQSTHKMTVADANTVLARHYDMDAEGKIVFEARGTFTRSNLPPVVPKVFTDPKRPAETAVLDRLVGEWRTDITVKPATVESWRTTARLTLGGRFVEMTGTKDGGGASDYAVVWYDPTAKLYRQWYFNSDGHTFPMTGTWDESTNALSWETADKTKTGRWTFNGGVREFRHAITDGKGKVLSEVTGVSRQVSPPKPAVAPFDEKQAKEHQEAWAKHVGEKVEFTDSKLGMEFRVIPPGEFRMGSPERPAKGNGDEPAKDGIAQLIQRGYDAESPPHPVRITRPFAVGKYEVTVGQFRKFAEAEKYVTTVEKDGGHGLVNGELAAGKEFTWKTVGYTQADLAPVWNVSADDAAAFCKWLSRETGRAVRLPTEAEWEWACRGGTAGRTFFPDKDIHKYAWGPASRTDGPGTKKDEAARKEGPQPVGQRAANPFGLHDTCGNVWEWCSDWYGERYYKTLPADRTTDDPTGPAGPDRGRKNHRVQRGGSVFHLGAVYSNSTARPVGEHPACGFRVVMELPAPADKPAK